MDSVPAIRHFQGVAVVCGLASEGIRDARPRQTTTGYAVVKGRAAITKRLSAVNT